MSEKLKEEIIQLISDFVDNSDAPVHEAINHLSDIVAACTKGVDDLTERELARMVSASATKGETK